PFVNAFSLNPPPEFITRSMRTWSASSGLGAAARTGAAGAADVTDAAGVTGGIGVGDSGAAFAARAMSADARSANRKRRSVMGRALGEEKTKTNCIVAVNRTLRQHEPGVRFPRSGRHHSHPIAGTTSRLTPRTDIAGDCW